MSKVSGSGRTGGAPIRKRGGERKEAEGPGGFGEESTDFAVPVRCNGTQDFPHPGTHWLF
jgi:hypothetical protein